MSKERSTEVQRLFDELIDLDPAARAARLEALPATGGITAEVGALLAAADRAGDFLGLLRSRAETSVEAPADRVAGDTIAGRYRLQNPLGQGATGDVYLAWDQQLERRVALKFLRASRDASPQDIARFISEARVAARLDHAHVATVHDITRSENGELFIVMSYYPGDTLRDRIKRGALPPARSLRIAAQIASALSAAHAAGIVHCDLKPANVLLDGDGAVRLADFSAARWLAGNTSGTHRGAIAGTIAYMAPEQARGDEVDDRTDLWALGVVLYEMLAGRGPFTGADSAAILHALQNDAPIPLPAIAQIAPETAVLIEQLLAKDAAQRPRRATEVRDLLEQLAAAAETAAMINLPASGAGGLPHAVTSFIGRERELALAQDLLSHTRLLTLTGPGGTGKTRLALQLSAVLREVYAGRIWFVPLAEISDPGLVPSIIARALGLRDLGGGMPDDRIITALGTQRSLLVLDNFEHVVASATFVSRLLAACPEVCILATSRVPLGVQGEQELAVPPLSTPTHNDNDPESSEAVQLFVQRALAVRPSFTLNDESLAAVVEICRRLDGLPLALELAAARAKLLSPRAMLARLEHRFDLLRADSRDRPSRHSTMRNVIEWSYVLLTDEERDLFSRLAVFIGGATTEAAEAVAEHPDGNARAPAAVFEALASLCNKSLLRSEEQADGEPRFIMLETVRDFALDRLRATGADTAVRRAHTAYYLALAERAATQLRGPAQAEWLDRLEREYANCRMALEDALNGVRHRIAGSLETAARLCIALHRLWLTRGPLLEGAEFLRRAIAAVDNAMADSARHDDTKLDARLLAPLFNSAAQLANTRSIFPRARDLFARSVALYREIEDRAGMATALNNLAWTLWIIGDLTAGETTANAAMELHEKSGNVLGATLSLTTLGWIAMERGHYPQAEALFARAIASHEKRGDQRATALTLGWVGLLAAKRGDLPRAISLHEQAIDMLQPVADRGYRVLSLVRLAAARYAAGEAGEHLSAIELEYLPLLREEGRLWPIAYTLTELGAMLRDDGQLDRSRQVLEEALDVRDETGALQGVAEARLLLGTVYALQGDSARAAGNITQALRAAISFGAIPTAAECVEAAAAHGITWNDPYQVTTLFAAADTIRRTLGSARAPRYESEYAGTITKLATTIGESRFSAAWQHGTTLSIEDAARIAIEMMR